MDLETLKVNKRFFKENELKKALKIIEENQIMFIRRWDEYFKS